jgi:hypothetical protein
MFKKFLAGLTTIALSLGMVALTAGPASAHHNTISVSVSCNTGTEGYWKVTWSVTNSESDKTETITSSTDTALVPIGTVIGAGATSTFVEYFAVKPTSNKTLTLGAQWSNGVTNSNSQTLNKNQFSSDCIPDDTDKKVDVCHYDSGQGGKYTLNDISVSAVLNGSGHAAHDDDIIPPFDYVKQGVAGHYDGKNWDAYGQWVYANGCSNKVTPTAPSFADAVCTGPGTYGQGSYTIPATTGVIYQVGSSASGPWTTTGAGTHPVAVGTHVFIQAIADTGYVLQGTTAWDDEIGSPSDCREPVTATAGIFTDQVCNPTTTGTISGYYTVPSSAHVTYQVAVNGGSAVTKAAGDYPASVGDQVTITPVADSGYILTGDVGPWSHTFISAGDCDDEATPIEPSFQDDECTGEPGESTGSTYTIPSTTGVQYQVKVLGVWIDRSAGTYPWVPGLTVQIRAVAESGYELTGTTSWSHTFDSAAFCLEPVTPDASYLQPTCVDGEPGEISDGSYTLVAVTGVKYFVKVNGGSWTLTAAGTYPVSPGDTVKIQAVGDVVNGYYIPGPFNEQDFGPWVFTAPDGDCIVDVVPVDPTVAPQTCEEDDDGKGSFVDGSITIAASTGVNYFIDGTPVGAGTHAYGPGTYTVTAEPQDGYALEGYPDGGWSLTVVAAKACGQLDEHPPVKPTVSSTPLTCEANGSYTLGTEEGTPNSVIWTVNGNPATDGTFAVTTAGAVTITAAPADGFGFDDPDQQTEWTLEFVAPAVACDLTTLALTGAPVAISLVGLWGVLTAVGVLLIVARKREQVTAER